MEVRFIRIREIEIPKAVFILIESLSTAQSIKRRRTQKRLEVKEIEKTVKKLWSKVSTTRTDRLYRGIPVI
jgi:hypothetical protein